MTKIARKIALAIAQRAIDAVAESAMESGDSRESQVASLAGILVCDLRGEDKGPDVVQIDLPWCIRRYASIIQASRVRP